MPLRRAGRRIVHTGPGMPKPTCPLAESVSAVLCADAGGAPEPQRETAPTAAWRIGVAGICAGAPLADRLARAYRT